MRSCFSQKSLPFLFLALLAFTLPVKAFAVSSPSAISVTPSLMTLDLASEKPETTLVYTNTTKNTIELTLHAEDFSELEDHGQLHLLSEADAKNYRYSLSSWIHIDQNIVTLEPGEKQAVHLTIAKEQLPEGGHYASILADINELSANGQVQLHGVLSSLLFVRAGKGFEREEAKLSTFSLGDSLLHLPSTILLRLQNTGNVQITPYGLIEVRDMFGRMSAKGVVNEGSLIALPESIRRYDVPIIHEHQFLFPGIYHLQAHVHFGKHQKLLTQSISFFSFGDAAVPLTMLVFVVLMLVWLIRRKKHINGRRQTT